MLAKARQKMIESLNQITGRNDCSEAVVLQQRPVWAPLALVGVFLALFFLLPSSIGGALQGAIAGGCAGLVFALTTTSILVGRFSDRVVSAKMSKLQSFNATEIVSEVGLPPGGEIVGGLINHKVTFNGETYVLSRALKDRFRAVMA